MSRGRVESEMRRGYVSAWGVICKCGSGVESGGEGRM
jgi:hypothetical protein